MVTLMLPCGGGCFVLLFASTFGSNTLLHYRKVLREVASGGRDAERVKLKLEIKVEVCWDYGYYRYLLDVWIELVFICGWNL